MDRHRFDADPDTTFHFNADPHPDSDPDPSSSYTQVGKSKIVLTFLFVKALPVYIVLSFSSGQYDSKRFRNSYQYLQHQTLLVFCPTRVQGQDPDTSGEPIVRAGQPLPPHTDESSTRLHGGLDSTLQVTSK